MRETWTGDVILDGSSSNIEDLHLWDVSPARKTALPSCAALRFLSNVHIPSIPLYLAIGPSLQVSTDNEDTASWLSEHLLDDQLEEIEHDASKLPQPEAPKQLENGILLKVESAGPGITVTEILLYAAIERQQDTLLTPPASSPSLLPDDGGHETRESVNQIKVYGLPLCSDILTLARRATEEFRSDVALSATATSLPDGQTIASASGKRQKLSNMFDDATQERRRLNGRGGERISRAMSSGDKPASQPGLPMVPSGEEATGTSNGIRDYISRAPSNVSLPSAIETRPASRNALPNGKRSALQRVESALSPREASTVPDCDSSFAQQNKAALTKVVLAGMRLHGLQQKKKRVVTSEKPTLSSHDSSLGVSDLTNDKEDEYKLVYHQTYRAAMFTFRNHFSDEVLGQNSMREVVDRLLELFCTDSATICEPRKSFAQSYENSQPEKSHTFDLPSSSAPLEAVNGDWTTPVTKKRR